MWSWLLHKYFMVGLFMDILGRNTNSVWCCWVSWDESVMTAMVFSVLHNYGQSIPRSSPPPGDTLHNYSNLCRGVEQGVWGQTSVWTRLILFAIFWDVIPDLYELLKIIRWWFRPSQSQGNIANQSPVSHLSPHTTSHINQTFIKILSVLLRPDLVGDDRTVSEAKPEYD